MLVFDAYPVFFGGSHRICELLAHELGGQGWEVTVAFPADGEAPRRLAATGVTVEVLAAPRALLRYGGRLGPLARMLAVLRLPGYWWSLHRRLRGVSVVWANDLRGWLLVALPARAAGCRLVWHLHARGRLVGAHGLVARVVDAVHGVAARMSDRVVVPSRSVAMPSFAAVATVLPNAVPDPGWRWCDPAAQIPVVVCVARLHPVKGQDVLLEASARLRERGLTHRVRLVGPVQPGYADYEARLRSRRAALDLGDVVELVGEVVDPVVELRAATVVVQPSREEPFGLATLEAMAAGVPVVVTGVGGLRDLVVDGQSGLTVAPDDADALADAVARVLSDPPLRRRLGDGAHLRASTEFGVAAFGRRAADICAGVG